MRSIWKGHIRFSLVTIPVRIYNAVETGQKISFNLLHKEDHGQVGYDKRCKKCNRILSQEEIVKGYPHEPDRYVIVEKEDLDRIKLKSTKIIEIEGFIDAGDVRPALYDAPYYAGPDGPVAVKAYALLSAALRETGKVGVGKVVLRDREDIVLVAPVDGAVALYKIRTPSEVRAVDQIPQMDGREVDKKQLSLARSLIESMTTELAELDLKDRYGEALREMIEAKIEGKEVVTVEEEEQPTVDIMTALKQSIEQARSAKAPMEQARGKNKTAARAEQKPAKAKNKKAG